MPLQMNEEQVNTTIDKIRQRQNEIKMRRQGILSQQQENRQLNLQEKSLGRGSLIDSSSESQKPTIPTSSLSNLQDQNQSYLSKYKDMNQQDTYNRSDKLQSLLDAKMETETTSNIDKSNIIKAGEQYMGTPYKWGGNDKGGIDCSGFTKNTFSSQGIELPRTAAEQATKGKTILSGTMNYDNLQPGDLLFFDTNPKNKKDVDHVGIYAGNGRMLHSGSSKGVGYTDLNLDYWQNKFVKANRY